ncbi:class I SAM-dependent methyltransferase [Leifsonia sp. ALI-44-B]|uniref:class I SAM-dependent methyltransferase n=1 Tax=Leifsonia sp. ALI-44-B TaxID=1933776 RepID=UPI0009FADC06|nr:class I SAM-dependent methyltransferase [Leifsonia sp. ALI-44-B]
MSQTIDDTTAGGADRSRSGAGPGTGPAEKYGDALADVYDLMYPWAEGPVIAQRLAGLVPPGSRALELGIGTGRVAIPAARAGLRVHGVEGSAKMLDILARHDREGVITTTHGDFTDTVVEPAAFDLVYVVCNTLFMLTSADAQIAALTVGRRQLAPGGILVVEAYDPSPFHTLERPIVQARHLAADTLMIDTVSCDPVEQSVVEIHTLIRPGTVDTFVEVSNYRWPRELDALARLAGLRLVTREGGWQGEPFVQGSPRHVSIYRAAEEPAPGAP